MTKHVRKTTRARVQSDTHVSVDRDSTLFEWAGGMPALIRTTRRFYGHYVAQDPLLAPVFADMAPEHPLRVARWLAEVLGGPAEYSALHGGYPHMLSRHVGKALTEGERARWVELILQSAHDAGLPSDPAFQSAFRGYLEWGSHLAVLNSQPGARPPEQMPMPRWGWTTVADPLGDQPTVASAMEDDENVMTLPSSDGSISFARHIKDLFRASDRRSMLFAFDLWDATQVRQHGPAILSRLEQGTMPCDGAWPSETVEVFARWVAAGMPD